METIYIPARTVTFYVKLKSDLLEDGNIVVKLCALLNFAKVKIRPLGGWKRIVASIT